MFVRILTTFSVLAAVASQVTLDVAGPYRGTFPGVRFIGEDGRILSTSANAGDFNNDGRADLILGHNHGYSTSTFKTYAFVVVGGMDNVTEIDLRTASSGPNFMKVYSDWSHFEIMNGVGDVNNDGYDDVLFSRYIQGTELGNNQVVFGKPGPYTDLYLGATILPAVGFLITNHGTSSVAPLGDVNGDGIDDFMISRSLYRATLFYGRPSSVPFTTIDSAAIVGNSTVGVVFDMGFCCYFGNSVAGPGDMNGDGLNDIVIGRPGEDGAVVIIYGSRTFPAVFNPSTLSASAGKTITGAKNQGTGRYVAAAGDVNGDGLPDVVASASRYIPYAAIETGFVQVIYGSSTGTFVVGKILLPTGSQIFSVASAGDINQDGFSDIVFADMTFSKVFVVMGRATPLNEDLSVSTDYLLIRGRFTPTTDKLGYFLKGGKDLNGDGFPDLIIAANNGQAYPVAGGPLRSSGTVNVIYGPLHAGPTALPTSQPVAEPTAVPSALPTLAPSAMPSEAPTAAPSFTCEVLVTGQVGETCATTCSAASPARVCDAKIFEKLLDKDAFLAMVSDSVDGLTGEKNGANYCNGGMLNTSTLNGPSVLSVITHQASGPAVRRFCRYATSLTAAPGCEETVPEGLPVVRLCPCTYDYCNEKPWKMSFSGESCTAACERYGSFCDPVQTGAAMDNESFLKALADSGEAGGCSEFNAPVLSSLFPALVTTTTRGVLNETFCSFPTARSATVDTCDAALTAFPPAQRLCACGSSRRLLAVETASKNVMDRAASLVASLRGALA